MNNNNNKTMLICGATGFIGRNLLEYYVHNSKYKIKATYFNTPKLSNYNNVEWIYCDLRNINDVKKVLNGVDIVLHFAATTSGVKDIIDKPYIHVTDNVIMSSLLLRESYEQNIKHFIFPSCTIMYKSSKNPIKETDFNLNDEITPQYFGAGNTKVYLEKMCEFYSRLEKTKYTVIRHSNIYGPYDKFDLEKSHVFSATITKIMNSKNGKITVWGSGEEERDLLHINDLINFIDLSLEKQSTQYELFNVGSGKPIKIKNLVEKIIHYSNIKLEIDNDLTRPTIPVSICLDCEKANKKLGWYPKISIDDGIIKVLDWYKKFKLNK